jgi:hypothetical protein
LGGGRGGGEGGEQEEGEGKHGGWLLSVGGEMSGWC